MDADYLKIAATVILAVIGWIIAHHYANKRAITSKRREIVTEHLINTYRVLANEISQRGKTPENTKYLEDILSDIQLFGSIEQVNLARTLAIEACEKECFELDPLINSLRNDLRTELGLVPVATNVHWLRENKQ